MDNLPNEVLLHILSYSNYWDLRLRLRLVNHRFDDLISNKTAYSDVDKLLFRDAPKPSTPARLNYDIHPIFRRRWLCIDAKSGKEEVYIIKMSHVEKFAAEKKKGATGHLCDGRAEIRDTYVADEHIFSPSVDTLMLQVGNYPRAYPTLRVEAEDEKEGITVKDTMEGVFKTLRENGGLRAVGGMGVLDSGEVDCPFVRPVVTIKVVNSMPCIQLSFAFSLRGVVS